MTTEAPPPMFAIHRKPRHEGDLRANVRIEEWPTKWEALIALDYFGDGYRIVKWTAEVMS